MSLRIAREPIPNLFPALKTLQQCHRNYNSILSFLEDLSIGKEKQINKAEQEIKSFLLFAENIVDSLHKQVQKFSFEVKSAKQMTVDVDVEPQNKIKSLAKVQAKKQQTGDKNSAIKIKPKRQNLEINPLRMMDESERENIKQVLIKKRCKMSYSLQDEVREKLKRNPQISQIEIQFKILSQKNYNWRKSLLAYARYYFCQLCNLPVRGSKGNYILKKHFAQHHKNEPSPSLKSVSPVQIFSLMKAKIDANQIILYKCNCMGQLFHTKQEFVHHLISDHEGHAPPFSSHYLSNIQDDNSLTENLNHSQNLVLEEILTPQFFYCGTCNISFLIFGSLYYDHIQKFHRGAVGNQNSHFLVEKKSRSFIKIHEKIKIKETKRNFQEKKEKNLQKKSKKPQIQVNEELTEVQLQFLKIIKGYQGAYCCLICEQAFESYEQMQEHFQNFPIIANHFHSEQKFLLIPFHYAKGNKNIRRYYLPLDLDSLSSELKELTLDVPIADKHICIETKWSIMTYQQFVEFVYASRMPKRCYYTWIIR